MAQRSQYSADYEEQPEAPDLGASVQLDSDETLVGPAGDRDPLDAGYVPPDRPYGLDEDGVTGRGMREGDTLDERLRREQGEVPADPDRAGRITIAGEGAALETPDAMDGVDVGIDGGAASAEEAAVHVGDDAGLPVETEPSVADAPFLDDPALDDSLADDPFADDAREQAAADLGGDPLGGDPGLPRDRFDSDPAARLDAAREAGGAAAPASGRDDVGPGTGL